jgi:hypothetical protein
VLADWKHGPRLLARRQAGRTLGLIAGTLAEAGIAG